VSADNGRAIAGDAAYTKPGKEQALLLAKLGLELPQPVPRIRCPVFQRPTHAVFRNYLRYTHHLAANPTFADFG